MRKISSWKMVLMTAVALLPLLSSRPVAAQSPSLSRRHLHHPWNEATPPGVAGNFAVIAGRSGTLQPGEPGYFQPVRVELPGNGVVTFYDRTPQRPISIAAPAQADLVLGHTYRLRISDMPDYPGIELYPTVELIDRLHPPAGEKQNFPVPVQLTQQEIDFALEGRLVTKVVFVERPQTALPRALENPIPVDTVSASSNLFVEANQRGRAMLIIRLGGRLPDIHNIEPTFFGSGGPVSAPLLSK